MLTLCALQMLVLLLLLMLEDKTFLFWKPTSLDVMCNMCAKWFHILILCAGLQDKDYEFLSQVKKGSKQILWICNDCSTNTLDVIKTVAELKERNYKIEHELSRIRIEIDAQVKESKSEIQRLNLEVEQTLQSISAEFNVIHYNTQLLRSNQSPYSNTGLWGLKSA